MQIFNYHIKCKKRINLKFIKGTKMKYLNIFLILTALFLSACTNQKDNKDTQAENKETKQLYTCTMHPQVISDHPGVCPICGMELVKKTSVAPKEGSNNTAGMISISNAQAILANVSTVKVKKEIMKKDLSAYSYIDFAEENKKMITARFNGRIDKLFVNKTGDYIHKGQKLFEIYSPDLVQAQNEFLIALGNSQQSGSNNILLKSAWKKLELLGITDLQINKLESSREVNLTLTYYSPFSGTVIEKKVEEGMYVNEGSEIYDVADISTVWNTVDVFEKDLGAVKLGSKVSLKLQAYPGESFEGKVSFIYPVINSQTRTVKVRTVFANSSGKLKPQMFGQTIFESNFGSGLVVPDDAIMFTGKSTVVWLKISNGMYEQHNVTVGTKVDGGYQILSGLKEGDEVAATGGFLLDSESQLKGNNNSNNSQDKSGKSQNNSGGMPGMKM
jgi:Cu(I)/Ag(I) efflux system membrane fusion protein